MTRSTFQNYLLIFFLTAFSIGCVSSKLKVDSQSLNHFLQSSQAFNNSFVGFSLYDPVKEKYIYEYNSNKFFTPASNTKLFTFYTSKKIFTDSIPGILYVDRNDTIFFTGTGDPTFLDEDFATQPVYGFLKNTNSTLVYSERNFPDERFGPGWAWDDYMYYYSPEKCSMPIYANVVHFRRYPGEPNLTINPLRFNRSTLHIRDTVFSISREEKINMFRVHHNDWPDTVDRKIPFIYSKTLFIQLLRDVLETRIYQVSSEIPQMRNILYSQHIDSLMKKMMTVSDNFIAEQMLIMGSGHLFDTLDADLSINYAIDHLIPELSEQIDWVDGSGLSRYNKFTPRAINVLLQKIYADYSRELILDLFPKGGISGTLKNNFKGESAYVVAKTGSLSNVYNLSGYLITKKGEWLIFSFMNNNFEVSSSHVKVEMERILRNIHEKY